MGFCFGLGCLFRRFFSYSWVPLGFRSAARQVTMGNVVSFGSLNFRCRRFGNLSGSTRWLLSAARTCSKRVSRLQTFRTASRRASEKFSVPPTVGLGDLCWGRFGLGVSELRFWAAGRSGNSLHCNFSLSGGKSGFDFLASGRGIRPAWSKWQHVFATSRECGLARAFVNVYERGMQTGSPFSRGVFAGGGRISWIGSREGLSHSRGECQLPQSVGDRAHDESRAR